MTIKEFYEWAKENDCEDYTLVAYNGTFDNEVIKDHIGKYPEWKIVSVIGKQGNFDYGVR